MDLHRRQRRGGGIADYTGVNTASPIDASGGQANASSTSVTAPSINIPAGNNSDRLLALFAIPNSTTIRCRARSPGAGISMHGLDIGGDGGYHDAERCDRQITLLTQGTSTVSCAPIALLPAALGDGEHLPS